MSIEKASDQAKAIGLKSLKQVTELTGIGARTLFNWSQQRPALFDVVLRGCYATVRRAEFDNMDEVRAELERLHALINSPEVGDFLEGVRLEAAHQVERWGSQHDEGKEPQDWLWLIGYLAGKALRAQIDGDIEKAKHHTISTAAVCLNWHGRLTGARTEFRPGLSGDRVAAVAKTGGNYAG